MKPSLRVIEAGICVTLQDAGRPGYQHFGLPVSGALDDLSRQIANTLAGNPSGAAALEVYGGPLRVALEAASARIAVAGASENLIVESAVMRRSVAPFQSVTVRRGDILNFGRPSRGAVYYVAAEGGFDIDAVFGSVSTYARSRLGGFRGRAVAAGDRLPLVRGIASPRLEQSLDLTMAPPARLKVMRGPNADRFPDAAFELFLSSSYRVSPASDRMGIRLEGPAILASQSGQELDPQGTTAGAIQVPPSGQPVLLLPDRQTTGGYPRIATVIGACLTGAGRLAPGMTVAFEEVTREQALSELKAQRSWLLSLKESLRFAAPDALSPETLLAQNLIGGVTAGFQNGAE